MNYDQEKTLDDSIKKVKAQSFHMAKSIEKYNLRSALKESAIMLAELSTGVLSPKNYYSLFSLVEDELHYMGNFIHEEYKRGRIIKNLYEAVLQAESIIPRLYLMITTGRVYLDSGEISKKELIFEMLDYIKGVQHPTKGLFLRYYFLKTIKEKLPDTPEEVDFSIKFIIQNIDEMNRLWVRLSTGCFGTEKIIRDKERNELKVLVGENLIRLASLESVTIEKYREDILPFLLNIVLESKDSMSQQYLLECIIHAFNDAFNVASISLILETLPCLLDTVDVKSILINIMEKLSKFFASELLNYQKEGEAERLTSFLEIVNHIYELLSSFIERLVEENLTYQPTDELTIIELLVNFMKYTIKAQDKNEKPIKINKIMELANTTLKGSSSPRISNECIKYVLSLLKLPLDHGYSIFQIKYFAEIMNYMDYKSRTSLSLGIIDSLSVINPDGHKKEVVNSIDKVYLLLEYIRPLTESSSDSTENSLDFAVQQTTVGKLSFAIKNDNPKTHFEMLSIIQKIYVKGDIERMKFTLPTLVNIYVNLANKVCLAIAEKRKSEEQKRREDLIQIEIDEIDFKQFCAKIYKTAYDLVNINLTSIQSPQNLIPLLYSLYSSLNLNFELELESLAYQILDTVFEKIEKIDVTEIKLSQILIFVCYLINTSSLTQDHYLVLRNKVKVSVSSFVKTADQSSHYLAMSQLYIHSKYEKSEEFCKEAVSKAVEFAEYSMSTNSLLTLRLYLNIVNKVIYYYEKECLNVMSTKKLSKLLEKIYHCINSIKLEEKSSSDKIDEIESYFRETINFINRRQLSSKIAQYSEVKANF